MKKLSSLLNSSQFHSPTVLQQIINLALVHREDYEEDKLQQECLLYQLHGNIDRQKTPLTKDQIQQYLASGATARTVLIEGAPGIGKSHLVTALPPVSRDETTTELPSHSLDLLYHPRQKIREDICREVEESISENVLSYLVCEYRRSGNFVFKIFSSLAIVTKFKHVKIWHTMF